MTDLIFSLDTEDYVNPKGADGIIRASKIIRDAGFTPCHNVVAWLAQALVKWNRQDAIDELKKCEITTHSLKHSYHPTINEYTDIEDFDEAMARFRKEEDEAANILKEILGVEKFSCACPPGNSDSYVARYGYYDMGIDVYNDARVFDDVNGRPLWYCNALNIKYDYYVDGFKFESKETILEAIEKLAKKKTCIVAHHPQMNTVTDFCDLLNFFRGNIEGEWKLSNLVPDDEVKRFEDNLKFFVETIKNDKRFNVTTFSEMSKKYNKYRVLTRENIPAIKKQIDEELFPVTTPDSYCLSDILLACRDFLAGKDVHECQKVYGFLYAPYTINQPVKVTAEEMKASVDQIKDNEFLPTEIVVGGKKLGTADWLRAALDILSGKEETVVVPDKWQIDLNQFPRYRDANYVMSWVHSEDFKDEFITDRARLQSWTIRLPEFTERKIYF